MIKKRRKKNIKISNGKETQEEIERIKQIIAMKKLRIEEIQSEISAYKTASKNMKGNE